MNDNKNQYQIIIDNIKKSTVKNELIPKNILNIKIDRFIFKDQFTVLKHLGYGKFS